MERRTGIISSDGTPMTTNGSSNHRFDSLNGRMKRLVLSESPAEEERTRVAKLTSLKNRSLEQYSAETRNTVTKIIDEIVCEAIFEINMDLRVNTSLDDRDRHCKRKMSPSNETLSDLTKKLNITKGNENVECPNCSMVVKCFWLTKHLATCMNPSYSFSGRSSSRVAKQRIKEAFNRSHEKLKNCSQDQRVKANRCVNSKTKKTNVGTSSV